MDCFLFPGVLKEPWFEVPYTVEPLPTDLLQTWAQPPSLDPALKMPPPNEYIPLDFSLKAEACNSAETVPNGVVSANGAASNKEEEVVPPVVINEEELLKLW
jgi:secreted Zn-dependent insulinase-like peptidase